MSLKHSVLQVVDTLPEHASSTEITDALLGLFARTGAMSDFARLYREQMTPDQIAEYLNPAKGEFTLDAVVAELENALPVRESA